MWSFVKSKSSSSLSCSAVHACGGVGMTGHENKAVGGICKSLSWTRVEVTFKLDIVNPLGLRFIKRFPSHGTDADLTS